MGIHKFQQFTPELGARCFIAPGAQVIGRVKMGGHCSVWPNAVLRGDVGEIILGNNVNIQDLSILHITDNLPLEIEDDVTIGHHVTLHSCFIGRGSLIGMGAVILDLARVGKGCLVAAGSVVTPRKEFPDYHLIKGSPAKIARPLTEEEIKAYTNHYKSYTKLKDIYLSQTTAKTTE